MASTTTGPIVMLGTKRPSITSTWSRSAPEHAEVRARGIDEHGVARAGEAWREGLHGSVVDVHDRHAEARGGLTHERQSRWLRVEGEDAPAVVHELGEVRGLGAGGGAGV